MKKLDVMIEMLNRSTVFGLTCLLLFVVEKSYGQQSLWYTSPAENWEEALPLGNGRVGAMVFGKTGIERIQLNENSLWPGSPDDWGNSEGTPEDLAQIRAFLFAGENDKADSMLVAKLSRKSIVRSHQTMGDLWIDLGHGEMTDYNRRLSLDSALSIVRYKVEGYDFTQEAFISEPDQVLVIRLKTNHPEGINANVSLSRPQDQGFPTVVVKCLADNRLQMYGEVTQRKGMIDSKPFPILHGVKFNTLLDLQSDGTIRQKGDQSLQTNNSKELVIKLVSATSYYHSDYLEESLSQIKKLESKTYEMLLDRHLEDYQALFQRVRLDLGVGEMNLPTDERIRRVKSGSDDLGLETLLFDFGRYLLISSSRMGSLPANLQGLWNQHIEAPWNADYHMNINLQMNYWPAEVTNLSELHFPLFDFTDKMIPIGKVTASESYGMRGTVFGHSTDIWGPTFLNAATAYWGGWFGASGWMMQHYWEHYLFTEDLDFLEHRVFPALHEVAQFYADWLVEDPRDGQLVSSPSTSPENSFRNSSGKTVATTIGAASIQQIITEVFNNYLHTVNLLGKSTALSEDIKLKLPKLRSGLKIGSDGRLMEWDEEYEEVEKGHRHMSHLYAFHPGDRITKTKTPELFDAAKRTLEYRLAHGGAGTGWSRAWLINFSARLHDGDMAREHIKKLITASLYTNLFDAHPPFQIDGNFGYTSGVAEMLLQSHDGYIHLLPALPSQWSSGAVKGLKARGDVEVGVLWEEGKVKTFTLKSSKPKTVKVMRNGILEEYELLGSGVVQEFEK
ncbi:glycoside hydrolase N-terminal domain-containing protein [Belliella marina]|uniref:Glycoside hydrolase N-terminal domain-containing protein n=1 Tax=Belliella marina TaxID=1644146 RepID=A0ABW4VQL3_9BACT